MKKILTIIGTRPQIIKSAAISRSFDSKDGISEIVLNTGQHYDSELSDSFFKELKINSPKYNLSNRGSLSQMIPELLTIINVEQPNAIIVYGDTNSTLAGAIAASIKDIFLVHIEAGLRSNNFDMPEEWNRILTDSLGDILFAPTDAGVFNLLSEGISPNKVFKTGDIMYDNAKYYAQFSTKRLIGEQYVFFTCHRPVNVDDIETLRSVLSAVCKISSENNIRVIFPMHPRTRNTYNKLEAEFRNKFQLTVDIIPPCGYIQTINYLQHCEYVITDSGGLQKEAYFFKKMSVILREETEWTEIIDNKAALLVGNNRKRIVEGFNALKNFKPIFKNIFGDGNSADVITKTIYKSI